jgi:hypothetical protein
VVSHKKLIRQNPNINGLLSHCWVDGRTVNAHATSEIQLSLDGASVVNNRNFEVFMDEMIYNNAEIA